MDVYIPVDGVASVAESHVRLRRFLLQPKRIHADDRLAAFLMKNTRINKVTMAPKVYHSDQEASFTSQEVQLPVPGLSRKHPPSLPSPISELPGES